MEVCEIVLTTYEIEEHINEIIGKVNQIKEEDIKTRFCKGEANSPEGTYAFSDGDRYHYLFTEKGNIVFDKITNKLNEISYWILDDTVFNLAMKYATDYKNSKEDYRRKQFNKELEIHALLGKYFYMRKKKYIEEILKDNPYR